MRPRMAIGHQIMSIAEILIITRTAIHIDTFIQQVKSILTGSSVTAGPECTGTERECKILSRIFRSTVHGYFTSVFIPYHFISPGRKSCIVILLGAHPVKTQFIIPAQQLPTFSGIPSGIGITRFTRQIVSKGGNQTVGFTTLFTIVTKAIAFRSRRTSINQRASDILIPRMR